MATIFCFSTTGNSLYVAKKMGERIGADVVSMSKPVPNCSDDVIGFVFPVYFWGLPKTVARFVKNLQIQNKSAYIFAITTYGGKTVGVTGALNQLLLPGGVFLQYSGKIKCVENYTPMYKINDTPEVHQKTDLEIVAAGEKIAAKQTNRPERYTFLNRFAQSTFPAKRGDCDQNFLVQSSCTGCGACEAICPASNIVLQKGQPAFQHRCEHCLACMHICPADAIRWTPKQKGSGRYRNPHVGRKELMEFCGAAKE